MERVQKPSLSVWSAVLAIAFLAILTVPHVAAKLKSLPKSDVLYKATDTSPACSSTGLCLQFQSSGWADRQSSGVRVPAHIIGVENLFQLKVLIESGDLKIGIDRGSTGAGAVSLFPHYRNFHNAHEVNQKVAVSLHFEEPSVQRGPLFLQHGENRSASRALSLTVESTGLGLWGALYAPALAGGLIFLLLIATSFVEARTTEATPLGHIGFAAILVARLLAVAIAKETLSAIPFTLTVAVILLPWLSLLSLSQRFIRARIGLAERGLSRLDRLIQRTSAAPSATLPQPFVLLTLAAILGVFAYCLWFTDSFRWSVFEERDFLEARQLTAHWTPPLFGPQLLGGGATPGGALYVLLTPVVALWNDPRVLHLLNQFLFLAIPLLIWWTLRKREPAGALFAALAFVSSQTVIALSYWPIHPNFSLAVGFFYAYAIIRGSVDGHKGWLIVSGFLLGLLFQLHFSYFMLLPCHIVLASFANCRGKLLKTAAVAAVFALLIPNLIADGLAEFSNIRQIAAMPRFHPEYVISAPAANTHLLRLTMEWLRQLPGLLANPWAHILALMSGVGIGSAIFWLSGAHGNGRRLTLSIAAAVLCCGPLFCLSALGMGYNSRHTISIVPGLFLLIGVGFGAMTRIFPAAWRGPAGAIAVLGFLAVIGVRLADSPRLAEVTSRQGEWAVDYRQREAIADDLIARLGVTPELYQSRVYWWWIGWSMAPEIFADAYRKFANQGRRPERSPAPTDFFLVTNKDVPLFLRVAFDVHEGSPVGPVYVYRATAKKQFQNPIPSGNSDTGVRLQPFLRQVDLVSQPQSGFVRLGQTAAPAVKQDLLLGTMADGRIKVLVTTRYDNGRLRWCVDSPSLNGHYQEIKTLWRPRLIVRPSVGASREFPLARDVLGNLLYKTPQCGEAQWDGALSFELYFAVDGIFDQSFMNQPKLSKEEYRLDNAPTIAKSTIDKNSVSMWMNRRFE